MVATCKMCIGACTCKCTSKCGDVHFCVDTYMCIAPPILVGALSIVGMLWWLLSIIIDEVSIFDDIATI